MKQAQKNLVDKIRPKGGIAFAEQDSKNLPMRQKDLVYHFLNTNCITVSKNADTEALASVFAMGPAQFVPILDGLRFKGVVFRTEFETNYSDNDTPGPIKRFISKEVPVLAPENSITEALEVFKGSNFDIIAVVDEEKNLMGLLHREEVENQYQPTWRRWLGVRS